MHAVARVGVGPAIDPIAVRALIPGVVVLALDTGVVGHFPAQRVGVAAMTRVAAAATAAVRREDLLGIRDPVRLIALAADLVAVLERDRRPTDRGRVAELGVAVAVGVELVPDEV